MKAAQLRLPEDKRPQRDRPGGRAVSLLIRRENRFPGRMRGDQRQRLIEQGLARLGAVPSGGPRGVRQWNHRGPHTEAFELIFTANHIAQPLHLHQLANRQLADRNHQLRPEQFELPFQPVPAMDYLLAARHPVTPFRVLAGKTAADRGHVDTSAIGFLIDPDAFEPFEQGLAGGPGKRPAQRALFFARRLTNGNDG